MGSWASVRSHGRISPFADEDWQGDMSYPEYCVHIKRLENRPSFSANSKAKYAKNYWKRGLSVPSMAVSSMWAEANSTKQAWRASPEAQQQPLDLQKIASAAGDYPMGTFHGQGIVIVAGGPIYSPPAYACLAFLRGSASSLPVELWVPPMEVMPTLLESQFLAYGAQVRYLGDVYAERFHGLLRGYFTKPAAMLASSFEDVLLLDADNLPLYDPAHLFQHPLYTQYSLLMWPDFWDAYVQPQAWRLLGILPSMRPTGSHEAGQIVLNKRQGWQPFMLALYFNLLKDVFPPMLSYGGRGDKETYPYAWVALNRTYGYVPQKVIAVGHYEFTGPNGTQPEHRGTAMLQRAPDGAAQFLHAHHPKLGLDVDSGMRKRRWRVLTESLQVLPLGVSEADANTYKVLNAVAGLDVEAELHLLQQRMRCSPEWAHYVLQPSRRWQALHKSDAN